MTVKNFRNLEEQSICFAQGLNILEGENAQGKTNILESICLLGWGKSPRADKEKEIINWDRDSSTIKVEYDSFEGSKSIEMKLSKKEKKRISINNLPLIKTGEILGNLNVVYFSPDEIRIIKEGPNERRRFLDIDLCQLDKNYYYAAIKYNKALAQRNTLLKTYSDAKTLRDVLGVFDKQMVKTGAMLIEKRQAFLSRLNPLAEEFHKKITDGKEVFALQYQTTVGGETREEIAEEFLKLLEKDLEKQQKLGYTLCGPHRDDVRFECMGIDIRTFGSQGQQRTAALSLKFAEVKLFEQLTKDFPVLLLDDVLSELDINRQKKLLSFSREMQTIITATHLEKQLDFSKSKLMKVKGGRAKEL